MKDDYPVINVVITKSVGGFTLEDSKLREASSLPVRAYGNLSGKGYFLNSAYKHKIVRDSTGALVLISYNP